MTDSTTQTRPSQSGVTQADVEAHVAQLQKWLERTPDYEGDDPRANHYRASREALTAAIAALTQSTPLLEVMKRAVIDAVCEAKLPYERQSAGRDDSGIALTLQRQRHWTLDAVKKVFDTIIGEG